MLYKKLLITIFILYFCIFVPGIDMYYMENFPPIKDKW